MSDSEVNPFEADLEALSTEFEDTAQRAQELMDRVMHLVEEYELPIKPESFRSNAELIEAIGQLDVGDDVKLQLTMALSELEQKEKRIREISDLRRDLEKRHAEFERDLAMRRQEEEEKHRMRDSAREKLAALQLLIDTYRPVVEEGKKDAFALLAELLGILFVDLPQALGPTIMAVAAVQANHAKVRLDAYMASGFTRAEAMQMLTSQPDPFSKAVHSATEAMKRK